MIRPYEPGDAAQVLALNAACVPEVGPMDQARLDDLAGWASVFVVVEVDDAIVGVLVGLAEGLPYGSLNYAWFAERYTSFAYVDRVAIAEAERGAGWGPALYRHVEAWARDAGKPVLCAEVNTQPPNPRSLRFHELFGFRLKAQGHPYPDAPDHRVGYLEKEL